MPPLLHRQAEAGRYGWSGRAVRAALRAAGQEVDLSEARQAKLRALVADQWNVTGAASALPGGAAMFVGGRAWALIDDDRVSGFGAALAWAHAQGAAELDVLAAPVVAGVVARRASQFSRPPVVWAVEGRSLRPAGPAEPVPEEGQADPVLVALLGAHGATPVFEHGVLRGEVLGLEVARVVNGHLEVGVGRHDRTARLEMRPDQDVGEALDEAVAAVASRRRAGAPPHPANTLARGRWLRAVVGAHPSLVGAVELEPVAPPLPWVDLPEAGAAPCVGVSDVGADLVVVCSVGVDLDLIPTAADCRLIYRPTGSLTVVVPQGDDVPITRALAHALVAPASVVTVPRDWASTLSVST